MNRIAAEFCSRLWCAIPSSLRTPIRSKRSRLFGERTNASSEFPTYEFLLFLFAGAFPRNRTASEEISPAAHSQLVDGAILPLLTRSRLCAFGRIIQILVCAAPKSAKETQLLEDFRCRLRICILSVWGYADSEKIANRQEENTPAKKTQLICALLLLVLAILQQGRPVFRYQLHIYIVVAEDAA